MSFGLTLPPMMKGQRIGSLWEVEHDMVFPTFRFVVRGKFGAKAACLDAHQRVQLGIEIGRTAEDLGGDLVFFNWCAGMIQSLLGEKMKQLAERLGAVKSLAVHELFDLPEELRPFRHKPPVTLQSQERSKARILLQGRALFLVTAFNGYRLLGLTE